MKKKEKELIKKSIDAIIETPFYFSINKKLKGVKIPKKIYIKPMVPGIVFRINKILLDLPEIGDIEPFSKKNFSDKHKKIVEENKDLISEVICLAWWNKEGDYPENYKKILEYGLENINEWLLIFYEVISRLKYKDFMIITMLGKSVGLFNLQEIIA